MEQLCHQQIIIISSFYSSSAAVAAPALTSAECSSASSQVVDNVPIMLNVEAKNVPHSSALTSPDRTVRNAPHSFNFYSILTVALLCYWPVFHIK